MRRKFKFRIMIGGSMEENLCPMAKSENILLDRLTQKEKLGCAALWLNALYTISYLAEETLSDDEIPCCYCPYHYKCPSAIREPELLSTAELPLFLSTVVPTPLIFKTALEPLIGEGTVIRGVFPVNRANALLRLKHMADQLEDNTHQKSTDNICPNN